MRTLLALLLLANLGFHALTQGWLEPYVGLSTRHEREPQRLQAQLNAPSVRVLDAKTAASMTLRCLRAGPFTAEQIEAAEAWLAQAQSPAIAWVRTHEDATTGPWQVMLGNFADASAMARRQRELQRRGVDAEVVGTPGTTPAGLSLGRFDDKAAAEEAFAPWQQRYPREALLVPPASRHWLRVEQADATQAERLLSLSPAVPGSGFVPCP
ncbi:MAG: hypothetical protein ACRC2B_00490 [Rubrivivax sp.]